MIRRQNTPSSVSSFRAAYPDFGFDIPQYACSLDHAAALADDFCSFEAYLVGAVLAPDHRAALLAALASHLVVNVPAYARLHGVSDFEDVPFSGKDHVRADPTAFVDRRFVGGTLYRRQTSGSTGAPITIFYTPEFYLRYLLLTGRKLFSVVRRSHAAHRPAFCVAVTDLRTGRPIMTVDPNGAVGPTVQLVVDERDPATARTVFEFLVRLRPSVVISKPSVFEILLEHVPTSWGRDHVPDCVFNGGTFLDPPLRDRVRDLFGAPVYDTYGLSEFGLVGYECTEADGFHVDESSVLLEVVDPRGAPVADGKEGELVLSSLANPAMPFLRYRTADLGWVDRSPCPCGLPGARIAQLSGRTASLLRFGGGNVLSPARFDDLFDRFPVREYRVTQRLATSLEIDVEPAPGAEVQGLLRAVRSHALSLLPDHVEVSVRPASFDGIGKFERYRTRVKGRQ